MSKRNLVLRTFSATVVLLAPTAVLAGPGVVGEEESPAAASGDFDGDGEDDAVYTEPDYGSCDQGRIEVFYDLDDLEDWDPLTDTVDETWTRSGSVPGGYSCDDFFGAAVAVGDFDGDGYDDLAIGAPGDTVSSEDNAGSITVLYGGSGGLSNSGSQLFHQDSSGVIGLAEEDDYWGEALAAGDFDCDGYDDLVIGTPREDVGSIVDAGAISVLYGSSSGLTSAGDAVFTQDTSGISGVAEQGDAFGGFVHAGNFNGDDQLVVRNQLYLTVECSDLAIGVPGEDLGSTVDAGSVNVIYGSASSGLTSTGDADWHRNDTGVLGVAHADDQYGSVVSSGDADSDGYDDLVIVTPFDEACGTEMAINLLYGSSSGITAAGDEYECEE